MALPLKHQTVAQFAARLRTKYKESNNEGLAKLAHWLWSHYQVGDITQVQIRTAFGLDTTEKWTAFRDRVMTLHDNWEAIHTASGE